MIKSLFRTIALTATLCSSFLVTLSTYAAPSVSMESLSGAVPASKEILHLCGLDDKWFVNGLSNTLPQPDDKSPRCKLLSRDDSSTHISSIHRTEEIKLWGGEKFSFSRVGFPIKNKVKLNIAGKELIAPLKMDTGMVLFGSGPSVYDITHYQGASGSTYLIEVYNATIVFDATTGNFCTSYFYHDQNSINLHFNVDGKLMMARFPSNMKPPEAFMVDLTKVCTK